MTAPAAADLAPATTPESVPAELPAPSDASGGYERLDFPYPDAPATTPKADTPPAGEAAATTTPSAVADPSDEEIERILRHEKGAARVEQLVNNRYGNELQKARADRATVERELREQATHRTMLDTTYSRLIDDPAYFDEMAKTATYTPPGEETLVGEPAVYRFIADYKANQARVEAKASAPAVDADQVRSEFASSFNTQAVTHFKQIAAEALPFYGELPQETRDKLARIDPAADGWLADAFGTLAAGMQEHVARLERQHREALVEATKAGKNDAIANREVSAPVIVENAQPDGEFSTWRQAEDAYAEGRIDRLEYHKQRSRFGVTY